MFMRTFLLVSLLADLVGVSILISSRPSRIEGYDEQRLRDYKTEVAEINSQRIYYTTYMGTR